MGNNAVAGNDAANLRDRLREGCESWAQPNVDADRNRPGGRQHECELDAKKRRSSAPQETADLGAR
jgi:hypothetical protein